ncbi:hypothetical protein JX265_002073 [Neoarthrinium moseri]|uniref:Beta-xylosidase C-terminal Concanavalin A-like domain-containing protein n=1 Tax=Neoarthrinium moseri TaxID=1658444 RepID=A0A9P9WWG6_9PEZI|nr:hypothetical protein JX265_002073 [Neoarthrinium moseri]
MTQLFHLLLYFAALAIVPGCCDRVNKTFTNPVLPGWNSDPSCVFVKELDNTFFCTTSTFLVFPGVPLYASKDLQNWKLVSHALNRQEQLPELSSRSGSQMEGIWASTIRYHEGKLHIITAYISYSASWAPKILLFSTTDPYNDTAWSDPVRVENPSNDIDPDLFFDDDGKVYMAVAGGIWISEIDITTGAASEPFQVWNGTGERNPEGPHLMKKDGYYYLWIGEGGTETNHTVTIARSTDIHGPYEGYPGNPLLTAKNTDEYFQTVGHADFFQDDDGNWWGAALSTRSGPEWEIYPMGRETVLFPMTWALGNWPTAETVRGNMTGPLPPLNKDVPTEGPFWDDADVVDFAPGSSIPKNFVFWRPPKSNLFAISPPDRPNTLQINPSRTNLSTDASFDPAIDGLGFVARKQTSSLFKFSVDLDFSPTVENEEAGISVFLTEVQHIDLGIILLSNASGSLELSLRFRVEASGKPNTTVPEESIILIPDDWSVGAIRLSVYTCDDGTYVFSASSTSDEDDSKVLGSASAAIVSGGSGPFTGTIIGAYATRNGGNGSTPAYFSRWRYDPVAQEIAAGEFV